MAKTASNLYPRSIRSNSRFLEIEISHNIGFIECTITRNANGCSRTIFQSDRDKALARKRELYRQKQIEKHKKHKKQSIFNQEYSTGLNIKECVLNIQALYLKQLVVEENHVREFAKIPGSEIISLKKNIKEVEKILQELQY
jgi:hypothetical protein